MDPSNRGPKEQAQINHLPLSYVSDAEVTHPVLWSLGSDENLSTKKDETLAAWPLPVTHLMQGQLSVSSMKHNGASGPWTPSESTKEGVFTHLLPPWERWGQSVPGLEEVVVKVSQGPAAPPHPWPSPLHTGKSSPDPSPSSSSPCRRTACRCLVLFGLVSGAQDSDHPGLCSWEETKS